MLDKNAFVLGKTLQKTLSLIIIAKDDGLYLKELFSSIFDSEFNNLLEVVVVDSCLNEEKSIENQSLFNHYKGKNYNIEYYKVCGDIDAMNFGVKKANGKWVCFVNSNFLFFKNAVNMIFEMIDRFSTRSFRQVAVVSLLFSNIRYVCTDKKKVLRQIEKIQKKIKWNRYNVIKLTYKNILQYGNLGTIQPYQGILFLRDVFTEFGGLRSAEYPVEMDCLIYRIMEKYEVVLSSNLYGGYVSLQAIYPNKEDLFLACDRWVELLEKESENLGLDESILDVKFKYIYSLISHHKSFGLTLRDFDKYFSGEIDKEEYLKKEYDSRVKYNKGIIKEKKLNEIKIHCRM